jgi:hypothetical protein
VLVLSDAFLSTLFWHACTFCYVTCVVMVDIVRKFSVVEGKIVCGSSGVLLSQISGSSNSVTTAALDRELNTRGYQLVSIELVSHGRSYSRPASFSEPVPISEIVKVSCGSSHVFYIVSPHCHQAAPDHTSSIHSCSYFAFPSSLRCSLFCHGGVHALCMFCSCYWCISCSDLTIVR